jgi:hypothetical protein
VIMQPRHNALALVVVTAASYLSCAKVADAPQAAFILTFDGPAHTCRVTAAVAPSGNAMACSRVLIYLIHELKIPKGSYFDWRTITDVDEREYTETLKALEAAGYQPTPGPHVHFITEPHAGHDH